MILGVFQKGEYLECGLNTPDDCISRPVILIDGCGAAADNEMVIIHHKFEVTVGIPVQPCCPHCLLASANTIWPLEAAVQVSHTVTCGDFKGSPLIAGWIKFAIRGTPGARKPPS
mgnify:CR=1 FL=1